MESLLPGLASAPNLHPLVVHFPIAFWFAAAGAWVVALARRSDAAWRFGIWLHTLGLASAGLAGAFGFWATAQMGHDSVGHNLIHVHRDFMLAATAIAVLITAAGWWRRAVDVRWRFGLSAVSLVLLVVTTLGADRGAELVFRYGVGVANETAALSTHDHDPDHSEGAHGAPRHGQGNAAGHELAPQDKWHDASAPTASDQGEETEPRRIPAGTPEGGTGNRPASTPDQHEKHPPRRDDHSNHKH